MFDDQKVDASQIEDRRPSMGTKDILKAAFIQQGWKPAPTSRANRNSMGTGADIGAAAAPKKKKNKRVPD